MERFIDRRRGFTLVEIMVVIVIVGLLVTFAVPQMLRSRMSANEVAAMAALRTISNACQAFYAGGSSQTYPGSLTQLSNVTPPYINVALAGATTAGTAKQGYYYSFSLDPLNDEHFVIIGWPKAFNRTGSRNFYIDEIGSIRYNTQDGLAPTINSPAVE